MEINTLYATALANNQKDELQRKIDYFKSLSKEIIETCWNTTSKLETLTFGQGNLPPSYKKIIKDSFKVLTKLDSYLESLKEK